MNVPYQKPEPDLEGSTLPAMYPTHHGALPSRCRRSRCRRESFWQGALILLCCIHRLYFSVEDHPITFGHNTRGSNSVSPIFLPGSPTSVIGVWSSPSMSSASHVLTRTWTLLP